MADEQIKLKKDKLVKMVSDYCDDYLDSEYKQLCIKLVEKLARKHEVPFKRGKLENWASGIVYVIGQINFLFDDSFEPYSTPDDICSYFGTKKSTASNKARDIRKMFNLKLGNEEFSTEIVLESDISRLGGDLSQIKTLEGAQRYSRLGELGDMEKLLEFGTLKLDLESVLSDILNSDKKYVEGDELKRLYAALRDTTFIGPDLNDEKSYMSDINGIVAFPVFTSQENFDLLFDVKSKKWNFIKLVLAVGKHDLDGVVINPNSENLFLSKSNLLDAVLNWR